MSLSRWRARRHSLLKALVVLVESIHNRKLK